jgi:hypothetical protein
MQILKLIKSRSFNYKKGGKLIFLPFFLFAISCAANSSKYGRVTLHNTADKNSFVFSASEEFTRINSASPKDKKFPKMTQAEANLLTNLLKEQKYCLSGLGFPSFIITSRQEKIYDMTFAHLIEKNYNTRPIAPRMYFGQCKKE